MHFAFYASYSISVADKFPWLPTSYYWRRSLQTLPQNRTLREHKVIAANLSFYALLGVELMTLYKIQMIWLYCMLLKGGEDDGFNTELISHAKQSRSEKKARKALCKLGKPSSSSPSSLSFAKFLVDMILLHLSHTPSPSRAKQFFSGNR